jgi:hypothetical protein
MNNDLNNAKEVINLILKNKQWEFYILFYCF